ncbi:MAG: leucine--tRNA ligase [Candidatus Jorgensenbacteria bacterium]
MRKYDFQEIEKKWQEHWAKEGTYEPDLAKAKKPFYNLMMFPYPSAEGLHVGNMYAFTGADIYGRMKRMQGYDVFEPIGLDGFGIHSENYAMKIGAHPMTQSKISEKRFYKQLEIIGNCFAWNEKLETYDPNYYKWTQWIFVQMWKHGLAYRKRQSVNWCPSCKTVLADEQVISGRCERCNSVVQKKELEQWFFRITKYADALLDNLEKIDWSERVKIAQRNWIGRSEGAVIRFPIAYQHQSASGNQHESAFIEVFTTRPDTLFGATYMVLAPEHELLAKGKLQIANRDEVEEYIAGARAKTDEERMVETKSKTGVELKGVKAINPASKEGIPIFIADYVLAGYGTGAIMAVPAHDERDLEFAKRYNLPVVEVVSPLIYADKKRINADDTISTYPQNRHLSATTEPYIGEGVLINSGKFDGMDSEKAKWEITKFVGGEKKIQYRLRDWLISRQRYWGAPIPMIYCEACAAAWKGEQEEMPGWYAAPEKDLPVELPYVKDFRPQGKGESPLASVKEFYEVECPHCGKVARRETDVSDTFLDSAWYYLRYPSVRAANAGTIPWDSTVTKRWFPVNLYIGGAEHAVLHLLYVRFVSLALHDMELLEFGDSKAPVGEPFPKFRAHGLLISEGAKMSKSRGNVVIPDDYIRKFGADTLRMYLMFLAPFEQGGDFRDAGILGLARFLDRVWKLFLEGETEMEEGGTKKAVHKTIKKVTEDIENLHYNTAISTLMILLNEMEGKSLSREVKEIFLKLLAPFAPHLAEEVWSRFSIGGKSGIHDPRLEESGSGRVPKGYRSIHQEPWPTYDPTLVREDRVTIAVQVNGKLRGTVSAPAGASQKEVEELARGDVRLQRALQGKTIKKVIHVPDRLMNFVE